MLEKKWSKHVKMSVSYHHVFDANMFCQKKYKSLFSLCLKIGFSRHRFRRSKAFRITLLWLPKGPKLSSFHSMKRLWRAYWKASWVFETLFMEVFASIEIHHVLKPIEAKFEWENDEKLRKMAQNWRQVFGLHYYYH